ncbi:MAG: hypothetical protein GX661_04885 [Acholeplasmataceae bacterium]|nr:hypothetical protein [Acholeplasmataceae bacterium]
MIDKDMKKFIETGKVRDYLNYKKNKKENAELSKELRPGEKDGIKRGDHS